MNSSTPSQVGCFYEATKLGIQNYVVQPLDWDERDKGASITECREEGGCGDANL
jgi:hypothetical protein